jgi:hypothetical protein
VNQLSLVCKTWQKAEQAIPHQPVQLLLKQSDLNFALVTWHLRDTSKLAEVKVLGDLDDEMESIAISGQRSAISDFQACAYHEPMLQLLHHLSDELKTPSLRRLALVPPRLTTYGEKKRRRRNNPLYRSQNLRFFTLVGMLGQLESLVLTDWVYSKEDMHQITHLTNLQNLKVFHSF